MLEDKKLTLQKCYELLSFLKDFDDNKGRREMTDFENVNIARTCDKNEAPVILRQMTDYVKWTFLAA